MSVHEFLDYIAKNKRYSEHTVKAYNTDLKEFENYLSLYFDQSFAEIDHKPIRSWFASLLNEGITARTIRRKASALKSFYKYLRKLGMIDKDPMTLVQLPKMSSKLPEFVDEHSIMELLEKEQFEDGYIGCRDFAIIDLFYQTGIRVSELINIEWNDIDFSQKTLKVLGKGNKERIIPLSNSIIETIKRYETYIEEMNFGNIFMTEKGQRMYPKLVYEIVNKYLSKVTTLNKKSPHVLRHTFATHMLNNGAELNTIKELLGHESLAATQVYTHNSIDQLKSIYKQAHPRA